MRVLVRIMVVAIVACLPAAAVATDPRDSLQLHRIDSARINLNPWGPHLGFETEIAGDDRRLEPLIELIREAKPGGGHKCANAGGIRFLLKDGERIGIGLLPGHQSGTYGIRVYDGDDFVATYVVDRKVFLDTLELLGLSMDDPAFRQ